MLLYPYVSPNVILGVNYVPTSINIATTLQNGIYIEYGNKQTISYNFTINKRTSPITGYTAMLNNTAIQTPAFQAGNTINGTQDITSSFPTTSVAKQHFEIKSI